MRGRALLLLWLLLGSTFAVAQPTRGAAEGAQATQQAAPPLEPTELRPFDAKELERLRADPAFQYDRDLRRTPTFWERFKDWIMHLLRELLGTRAGSFVAEHLLYIMAVAILLAAVIILRRNGLRAVFHGAPRSTGEVTVVDEDIRSMDIRTLIAEAESAGDLRRAIRLHYLLVLRALVDQGVLTWSPDRTDRDYMAQIKDPGLRARFAQAALVFQWVWYGHAEVDRARYETIRRPFLQFERAADR